MKTISWKEKTISAEVVLGILKRVYTLIEDKEKWCQGANARDRDGYEIHFYSQKAVSWCLRGAVLVDKEGNDEEQFIMDYLAGKLNSRGFAGRATQFNDSHNHGEVLTFLEGVILELEEEIAECREIPTPIQD